MKTQERRRCSKTIEQMFVSQEAYKRTEKSRGSSEPRLKSDYYFFFFFAAFLTFLTAFFTAFLTFFLAAISFASFY